MFEQMVGVFLGEGGVGSDIAADGQPDEPAVMRKRGLKALLTSADA